MLTAVLAHAGQPVAPHDLWTAWNPDPVVVLGLALGLWVHRRGQIPSPRPVRERWRARCFIAAVATLGVALLSPLEAMSAALASAHMVQHVLLILVAAPLLALSAPSSALLRGSPVAVRRASGRWVRRLGLRAGGLTLVRHPVAVWLLHTGTVWFWHAAGPYDAALQHEVVHVAEHASFLLTGLLFWRVVLGPRRRGRVPEGLGALLVFGMALQSVFLSLLLTFATSPWYAGYAATTAPWGLDPLADQQLAGVIMWVPAGVVYVIAALALVAVWIRTSEAPPAVRSTVSRALR